MQFPRFLRPILKPLGLAVLLATTAPAHSEPFGDYLAARSADMSGDFEAVVTWGTEVLASDPSNFATMEHLILAQIGLGKMEEAKPYANRLISVQPDSQVAGFVLIADATKRQDWPELSRLIASDISIGLLIDGMITAWAAIGEGRMNRGLEVFDELAATPGLEQIALLQKALALAWVGDFEGSAKIFAGEDKATLSLQRSGILAYATILSQLERNPDAVELIDMAFQQPFDPELAQIRAELAAGKPLPFTALEGPQDGLASIFFEVGNSIREEADPLLVLVYARLAEYFEPENFLATLLVAQEFEEMGNFRLAAEAYGSLDAESPAYAQAQLGRAGALHQLGDVAGAIAALEALADAHPDLPVAHSSLGDIYRFEKRYAEALPIYSRAIALYDEPAQSQWATYFARGICHEREGDWPAAEADFRRALELSADQPSVLNYLGYSYVERRENFDEALAMIETAVEARPFDGYIRDSLGWVYFRLGRFDDAVREMERAVELLPVDPVLNDHLGDTYWAVGRVREAEFQWNRALSFVTDDTNLEELKPDRIRRKLDVGLDQVLAEEGAEPLVR